MSIAERVNADLPFLRRFARSVTGSQEAGDAVVVSTLETIVADPGRLDRSLPPRVALYGAFLDVLNTSTPRRIEDGDDASRHTALQAAERKLQIMAPKARQAFLLVAVEEFSPSEAARAMGVSE